MNSRFDITTIFITFLLMLATLNANARVEVSGPVLNDTVWTNDDTVMVISTVTVADTAHLTVEAGTVVVFKAALRIIVYGGMTAIGDESNPIHFTSATDTAGGAPKPGDWYGLDFQINSAGELTHCQIRYPTVGTYVYCAAVSFTDCLVENFMLYGLQVNGGSLTVPYVTSIKRCTVRQTVSSALGNGTGIFGYQRAILDISRTYVNRCEKGMEIISNNTNVPSFDITYCDISDNDLYGIYLRSGG